MNRRLVAALGVVVAVFAGVVVVLTRPVPGEKEQVAQVIIDVKRAVEAKSAGGVLKHVADDYRDGTYTKRDLTQLVIGGFRTDEPFRVIVQAPEIQVAGSRAQAHVTADFSAGETTAASVPLSLDIRVEFVKARGQWRIVRATGWEPATGIAE